MSSEMRVDDALDIIAKRCIANLIEHDKGGNGSTQWEDWPEIGEQDWSRVLERMDELVPDDPAGDKVKQAYATLAARAVRDVVSERAGTPTHGRLDRETADNALADLCREVLLGRGLVDFQPYREALEACVVPDPRLGRIEALCLEGEDSLDSETRAYAAQLRAILRGDQ